MFTQILLGIAGLMILAFAIYIAFVIIAFIITKKTIQDLADSDLAKDFFDKEL